MTEKEWRKVSDEIEGAFESKNFSIVKDANTWKEENREKYIQWEIDVLFQDKKIDGVVRDVMIDVPAYKVTRNEGYKVLLLPPSFSLIDFDAVIAEIENVPVVPDPV